MNVLCLWLSVETGVNRLRTLEQSPSFLSVQEGMHAILNCTFQVRTFFNFHWCLQDPGKGFVSLTLIQSSQKEQGDKYFQELLGKQKFYSVWNLPDSHPGDSATYFCALWQCLPSTCSLCHDLQPGPLTQAWPCRWE